MSFLITGYFLWVVRGIVLRMEAEDVLDLPASSNSGLVIQKNGLESGSGSPEANPLVGNEENMSRNLDMEKGLDLKEENLRTLGGQCSEEVLAEQVSDVFNASIESVVVDEKLGIQKETLIHSATLDVSCILLLLFFVDGYLHFLAFSFCKL